MTGLEDPTSLHYWLDFTPLYLKSGAISHAHKSGNLVFFLGSGASKSYAREMPNWCELLNALLAEVQIPQESQREEIVRLIRAQKYLVAAEALKRFALLDSSDKDLAIDSRIARILQQAVPRAGGDPTLHLAVLDFSTPVVTTNFDGIVELVMSRYGVGGFSLTPLTYEDERDASQRLNPTLEQQSFLFKLHGTIGKVQRLIFDEADFSDFYFQALWPKSLQLLRHLLATKMVVFVGFSMTDPEVMLILREAMRYASSYQHLALMHEGEITSTEQAILRDNYRVDPILYQSHAHLPLLIMEMRNFTRREDLPLQLRSERDALRQAAEIIRIEAKLEEVSAVILFGSYAKYGRLTHKDADVDMLLLTPEEPSTPSVRSEQADSILRRRIDATLMTTDEFERLLRCGDTFASSVLITGSPLVDADGSYGLISRGFLPSYDRGEVCKNALDRYRMRWLRLCLLRDAEPRKSLHACHQWAVTLMQLLLLRKGYPLDSVLSVSLLGNARFTIRRFAAGFRGVDEDAFLGIMRGAKGLLPAGGPRPPGIKDVTGLFLKPLGEEDDATARDLLLPGEALRQATLQEIGEMYWRLSEPLAALSAGQGTVVALNYEGEQELLDAINVLASSAGPRINTFDWLFFILLHENLGKAGAQQEKKESWMKIVRMTHATWVADATGTKAQRRSRR